MSIIDEIRNDVQGAAVLKDWLGEGVPVRQEHAQGRALVCLRGDGGKECPRHKAARWWEFFKHPVAGAIKDQIALKSRMKLETPHDAALKMCQACGCCMQVKIWVPMEHIKAHATPEQFAKMPAFCWQRRESELL